MPREDDVTGLLAAWSQGNRAADSRLMAIVYRDLRRVALRKLRAERAAHSLAPTALGTRGLPTPRRFPPGALAESRPLLRDRRPRHATGSGGPCARACRGKARRRWLESARVGPRGRDAAPGCRSTRSGRRARKACRDRRGAGGPRRAAILRRSHGGGSL